VGQLYETSAKLTIMWGERFIEIQEDFDEVFEELNGMNVVHLLIYDPRE
jgi:hypothetical protein